MGKDIDLNPCQVRFDSHLVLLSLERRRNKGGEIVSIAGCTVERLCHAISALCVTLGATCGPAGRLLPRRTMGWR